MEKLCKCVNIQYVPRVFTGEAINVGVVFHNVQDNELSFRQIRKTSRIKAFDDELDISEFRKMLGYIKDYILNATKVDLFNKKSSDLKEDFLESASKMFLNKYQFSNIITLYSDNPKKDFINYSNEILYYDLDKEDRPTNDQTAKIMKKVIYSALYKKSFDFERSPLLEHTLGEDVRCDFKIENQYFKAFNLTSNNYTFKYNFAKTWVYNSDYLKKYNETLVFVLSREPETQEERILYRILSDADSKILYLDQLDNYMRENFDTKVSA